MNIEVKFVSHEPQSVSIGGLPVREEAMRGGCIAETVFSYADAVERLVNMPKITEPDTQEPELPLEQE